MRQTFVDHRLRLCEYQLSRYHVYSCYTFRWLSEVQILRAIPLKSMGGVGDIFQLVLIPPPPPGGGPNNIFQFFSPYTYSVCTGMPCSAPTPTRYYNSLYHPYNIYFQIFSGPPFPHTF